MAEPGPVLLSRQDIAVRVERMADQIAPLIDDDTVCVCLLTGGLWFAADLTRALSQAGRNPLFDALWLSSYGDGATSSGRIEVRAGLQRDIAGRKALLIDDVFDSGLSLDEAGRILREAGASEVLTAVFARKPWPYPRPAEPNFVGWDAPSEYLVGYGLDDAGRWRGLADIRTV